MRKFAISFTSRERVSDTISYLKLLQTKKIDLLQYRYLSCQWLIEVNAEFEGDERQFEIAVEKVLLNKFSGLIAIELLAG